MGLTLTKLTHNQELMSRSREITWEQLEYAKNLNQKGHTCVMIVETFPPVIRWCEQEKCTG